MSVVLEPPSQLIFKRPLTQPIEEYLYVKNVGTEPIAFKVKTTAPKQYCVRPNTGIINPSSHVEVQVIFQPFKEEPAPDFKCKDKFLVQTAVVKPEWTDWNMVELWGHIETEHRENMSQRKVKCVFLAPELPQPQQQQREEQSIIRNEEVIDEPPTPTSSHDQSIIDSTHSNGMEGDDDDDDDDENDTSSNLITALPAIIDAVNRSTSNNNKSYDPTASSVSLSTAHTAMATTPKPFSTSSSTPPPQQQQQQQQQPNTTPIPLMTTPTIDPKIYQQLKDENETLQLELKSAREQQNTIERQLLSNQNELKSATSLNERLQQQIKILEQENQTLVISALPSSSNIPSSKPITTTATAAAAHAMQSSPFPVDGYPPQVLLSVSALVFLFTYLFF